MRQGILEGFLGDQIHSVWSHGTGHLLDPASLALKGLAGETLLAVERRGKYLRWVTLRFQFLVHLGMTGVWSANVPRSTHTHLEITFANGHTLTYTDPRQFGYLCLAPVSEILERWEALGPDAISAEFCAKSMCARACKSQVAIKIWIMDQHHVAGIGNIYASEALFRAHIHPARAACSLDLADWTRLVRESKAVLRLSIRKRGTTFSDYRLTNGRGGAFQGFLKVFQKPGEPCPDCAAPIQQITQGGRSTFFCAHCQR